MRDIEIYSAYLPYEVKGMTKNRNRTITLKPNNMSYIDILILRPLSDLPILVSNSVLGYLIGLDFEKHRILYSHLQFLLKNHFDVFGLIEKGKAIDINTIK